MDAGTHTHTHTHTDTHTDTHTHTHSLSLCLSLSLSSPLHRCSYGLECLFRFYGYGLETMYKENRFNMALFLDFQVDVIRDWNHDHLYGLEKFVSFLDYASYPGANIRPEIQE